MMEKNYVTPELEIIEFDNEDVITTRNNKNIQDGSID